MGMKAVVDEVSYVLKGDTRATPFTEGIPGRKWCEGFLERHPGIRRRVTQLASRMRLEVTHDRLEDWFRAGLNFFATDEKMLNALADPE